MQMRAGIDLGGTKIEGIALDQDGRERARKRIATPQGDYAGTVAAVAGLVRDLAADAEPVTHVGVGIPGTIPPATGLVKNANSTCLIGHPLDQDLAAATGLPVRLANDANCFTISEAADGAGAGARVVFGVIIGTGVGGGIAVDGRPVTGPNAIAGEWGHNSLPWPLPRPEDGELPGANCYCGLRGCIETFLSGPGLARDFKFRTGKSLTPEDIAAGAAAGDGDCEAALARYENRLARALATVINMVDPDVIVLGGGLSNMERLYANVPTIWGHWVFSDTVTTKLNRNRHGDASGVRGAAWLWPTDA
ncbi:MAG: ROK family protein [Rhodospirillaceae bacterium]